MDLLLKLVPWYYRWIAMALLVAAAMGWAAYQMHEHDEDSFQEERNAVKQAAFVQKMHTDAVIAKQAKDQKEIEDAHKKELDGIATQRDAALKRLQQYASGRFVPAPVAGPGGVTGAVVCYSAAGLDQKLREWVGRERRAALEGLGLGQGAVADRSAWEKLQQRALVPVP